MRVFAFANFSPIDNEVQVILVTAKTEEDAMVFLSVYTKDDYSLEQVFDCEVEEGIVWSNYQLKPIVER